MATIVAIAGGLLVNENFTRRVEQRFQRRRTLENLIEGEFVRDETLDGQLLLGDEFQQHRQRVCVYQTHRDVDVLDPEFVQR